VRVTHPERVLFPEDGVTKGDLARYYVEIGDAIVPHLRDRPFTLKRYPHGIHEQAYFHKQAPKGKPDWIPTRQFRTWPRAGESRLVDFTLVNETAALVWMVQMNCIDMNAWYSRVDKPDRPDYAVFDLDPPETRNGFVQAIRVAHLIREALEKLELHAYPKTSGADGIHVLVPIARRSSYKDTYELAERVSRGLEAENPGLVTTEWLKKKRSGVLVDHRQNGHGKTIAAAYSVPSPARRSRPRSAGRSSARRCGPATSAAVRRSSGWSATATCSSPCCGAARASVEPCASCAGLPGRVRVADGERRRLRARERYAQHPELLLELAHDLDQDVLRGEVELAEPLHASANPLGDIGHPRDQRVECGVGVERSRVDRVDLAVAAHGCGTTVGCDAQRDRALRDRVGEVVPRVDELVEMLVQRLERPPVDVPVQLLPDQREIDQLDERRLELAPRLVAVMVVEGREMCLL
jgi:bifunctional non-homologous end joining protein LigD